MKRTVSIVLEFDPAEYDDTEDSREGAVSLALDMLRGLADLPDDVSIVCEQIIEEFPRFREAP
jgi:hypothetical protein